MKATKAKLPLDQRIAEAKKKLERAEKEHKSKSKEKEETRAVSSE
ncbi:MAG: hypothetical protein ACI4KE_03015 [Anaerovoracaceae bacterium]